MRKIKNHYVNTEKQAQWLSDFDLGHFKLFIEYRITFKRKFHFYNNFFLQNSFQNPPLKGFELLFLLFSTFCNPLSHQIIPNSRFQNLNVPGCAPSFSYILVYKNLQHYLISTLLFCFYGNFFTVLYFSPLGRSIIGQQSKQLPEVFHWIPTVLQLVKQVTYVLCTYFQAAFSIFSNSPMIKIPKECQKQDLTVTPSKRVLSSPPTQHNGTRIVMILKLYFKFHFYFY